MTLEQAKKLRNGQTVYQNNGNNADGSKRRWKVTSVKTWKTKPDSILIGLKHGLYRYDKVSENDLHLIDLE